MGPVWWWWSKFYCRNVKANVYDFRLCMSHPDCGNPQRSSTSTYLEIEFSILVHGGDIGGCLLQHAALVPTTTEPGQGSTGTVGTVLWCDPIAIAVPIVASHVITCPIGNVLLLLPADRVKTAPQPTVPRVICIRPRMLSVRSIGVFGKRDAEEQDTVNMIQTREGESKYYNRNEAITTKREEISQHDLARKLHKPW